MMYQPQSPLLSVFGLVVAWLLLGTLTWYSLDTHKEPAQFATETNTLVQPLSINTETTKKTFNTPTSILDKLGTTKLHNNTHIRQPSPPAESENLLSTKTQAI